MDVHIADTTDGNIDLVLCVNANIANSGDIDIRRLALQITGVEITDPRDIGVQMSASPGHINRPNTGEVSIEFFGVDTDYIAIDNARDVDRAQ